jgi:Fic family protein
VTSESRSDPAADARRLDAAYRGIPIIEAFSSASVDEALWAERVELLNARKASANREHTEHAVTALLRMAAMDTGAIEGLYKTDRNITQTVASEVEGWRHAVESQGNLALRFFEAQLTAFEWLLGEEPLTEKAIRELHARICEPEDTYQVLTPSGAQQQELPKGEYKRFPNHVVRTDGTAFAYAPVALTTEEMHRLVEQMNSEQFRAAHLVIQAAYAHYVLVRIHPFADGNGRVARALSSAIIMRTLGVPLIVFYDERERYFAALRAADDGEYQQIVDFAFDRCLETFAALADELRPAPEVAAAALRGRLLSHGGLPAVQLDTVADQLLTLFATELTTQVGALQSPEGVQVTVGSGGGGIQPNDYPTHRYPSSLRWISLQMSIATPVRVSRSVQFGAVISKERNARYPLLLMSLDNRERYPVLLEDLQQLSDALRIGLKAWVRGILGSELAVFDAAVQQEMIRAGLSN